MFYASNTADMTRLHGIFLAAMGLCAALDSQAQVDPTKRELIQLGYNLPLEGSGPLSAYAFY